MNARKENESFKEYRLRLKNQAWALKHYMKGRLFWNSRKLGEYRNPLKAPFCCLK